MVLVYILSMRSLGSLFVDKSEPVQVDQWQEIVDNNNMKVTTITKKVSNSDEINSWENILQETGNLESEIIENSYDEEYEEIVFQDNFDKEYRSGTEDNYLED
jgi:hypothetical protein